jgi:CubicO group peptidase (beta-lactamase class C family)
MDESSIAGLDECIQREMRRIKAPGLSIAIVAGKTSLLEKGYGWADRAAGRKADADTIFNLGSVSKLFTNVAIMTLVEKGIVELDAPVTTYVPELGGMKTRGSSFSGVTLRSMLCHHSGLPSDFAWNFTLGSGPSAFDPTAFRALPGLLAGSYVAAPPGRVFSYSNLAFSLLGLVVERSSGASFEDYLQSAVFKPLGMDSSSFALDASLSSRYAKGYEKGRKAVDAMAIRDIAAGQLMSSARDMSRFLSSCLASLRGEGGLLKSQTMRGLLAVQNADVALDFGFRIGLTWWLMETPELPGLALAGHGGDLPPFHALLLIAPEKDVGVEISVNNAQGMGSMELKGIAVEALGAALRSTEGRDYVVAPERPAQASALPSGIDASVAGWYSSTLGLLRLTLEGGGLRLFLKGKKLDLLPLADGSFCLRYRLLGLLPIPIPLLKKMALRIERREGKPWISFVMAGVPYGCAERIKPEPIDSAWMARRGKYKVLNPDSGGSIGDFRLRFDPKSGFLMLDFHELGSAVSYPLRPIGADEAVSWGTGRNMGETATFSRDSRGEILAFSGFRLRKN